MKAFRDKHVNNKMLRKFQRYLSCSEKCINVPVFVTCKLRGGIDRVLSADVPYKMCPFYVTYRIVKMQSLIVRDKGFFLL